MTKEETISNLKAYLDGDTAIGNIIPLRSVLELAIEYLGPSLPANLDEAAVQAHIRMEESGEEMSFLNTFKAGVEWLAGQGVVLNLSIDELSCDAYNACVEQGLTSEDDVIIQIRKK